MASYEEYLKQYGISENKSNTGKYSSKVNIPDFKQTSNKVSTPQNTETQNMINRHSIANNPGTNHVQKVVSTNTNQQTGTTNTNSTTSTFKTAQEAQQYAKNNNINLGNTIPQIPKLITPTKSISVQNASEIPSQPKKQFNFYNDVVEPTNNFMDNAIYGAGEVLAKPIMKWVGGGAYNLGQLVQGKRALSAEEMQQVTDYGFNNLKSILNKGDKASNAGNVVGNVGGYMLGAAAMGGSPLAYGAESAIQASGNTNDVGDIAFEGAVGTGFGYLNKGLTSLAGKGISAIAPATNALSKAYNPIANVAKNAIAGGAGMYGAGGVTGTVRNAYNEIRNRINPEENRNVDWKQPWFSTQALTNLVYGAISNGINGTKADIQNAKVQAVKDVVNLQQDLTSLQAQFDSAVSANDIASARSLSEQIQNRINAFGDNWYLGKNASTLVSNLNNQWQGHVGQAETFLRINQGKISDTTSTPNNSLSMIQQNAPQLVQNQAMVLPQNLNLPEYSGQVGKNQIDKQALINLTDEYAPSHKGETYVDENLRNISNNKSNHVAVIDLTNESNFDENGNLRLEIAELLKDSRGKEIYVKDIDRTIKLNQRGINELQHTKLTKEKVQAISRLEDNASNSVYYNSGKDIRERPGVNYDYTVSAAKTKNGIQPIMTTIMNTPRGSTLYNMDALKKDTPASGIESFTSQESQLSDVSSDSIPSNNNVVNNEYMQNSSNNTRKTEELVETNIGKIPLEEYRDIMAQQAGFDNYNDMRRQGFKLENKYDIDIASNLKEDNKPVDLKMNPEPSVDIPVEEAPKEPLTLEQITQIGLNNAKAKRNYERALKREGLTPEDKIQLDRLVKGEITLDEIPDRYNKEGISRLYPAKKTVDDNNRILKENKKAIKSTRLKEAESFIENSTEWKDKKLGFQYSTETAERNIYDVVKDRKEAKEIIDTYFKPIHEHEANATRQVNGYVDKINSLGISIKDEFEMSSIIASKIKDKMLPDEKLQQNKLSESSLVQLYGEGIINQKDIEDLGADFSKIHHATDVLKGIYNEMYTQINKALVANGYDPVEYRKDYFPHFSETKPDNVLQKLVTKLGISLDSDDLPTEIAGQTQNFKPGKKWSGNLLHRSKNEAYYDALKGFDRYVGPVMDVIHHTDDIQKLRALTESLRYKYSDSGIKAEVDAIRNNDSIDDIQKNILIQQLYSTSKSTLSHFTQWLDRYTNTLAGKKSQEDREMEYYLSRNAYKTMKNIEGRIAANMIGANINSAITNFIPIAQATGEISLGGYTKALWDMMNNIKNGDGFVDKSTFLTNRRGKERTYKTTMDKVNEKTGALMEGIDNFTSELLVRAKYCDNIKEGMSIDEAMDNANEFAAGLMADRSKGSQPLVFNATNPFTKLFTMFQLEVNNQYRYAFKDLPRHINENTARKDTGTQNSTESNSALENNPTKNRAKIVSKLAWALTKICLASYAYNEIKEKIIGTRAATDPIKLAQDIVTDIQDENVTTAKAITNAGESIIQELPFVSGIMGGGRIPISSALPNVENTITATSGLITGEADSKKSWETLAKELGKPLYYYLFPTSGGQVKKAAEGVNVLINQGKYSTNSKGQEQLQFPIDLDNMNGLQKAGKIGQALLFGQYSSKEARNYFENGGLSVRETIGYNGARRTGMSAEKFMNLLNTLKQIQPKTTNKEGKEVTNTTAKKAQIKEVLDNSDLTTEQKRIMYGIFYNLN